MMAVQKTKPNAGSTRGSQSGSKSKKETGAPRETCQSTNQSLIRRRVSGGRRVALKNIGNSLKRHAEMPHHAEIKSTLSNSIHLSDNKGQ